MFCLPKAAQRDAFQVAGGLAKPTSLPTRWPKGRPQAHSRAHILKHEANLSLRAPSLGIQDKVYTQRPCPAFITQFFSWEAMVVFPQRMLRFMYYGTKINLWTQNNYCPAMSTFLFTKGKPHHHVYPSTERYLNSYHFKSFKHVLNSLINSLYKQFKWLKFFTIAESAILMKQMLSVSLFKESK